MSETSSVPATAPTDQLYFRYSVPPSTNSMMCLLTTGGVLHKGVWQGELGEFFVAWCPMPRVDKAKEAEILHLARQRRIHLTSSLLKASPDDAILKAQLLALNSANEQGLDHEQGHEHGHE